MGPNVKILKVNLLFLLTICLSNFISAQEAFNIDWNKQWQYMAVELGLNAASYGLYVLAEPSDYNEWKALDRNKIPRFDRISLSQSSSEASAVSDYIANGSFVLPVALYLSKIKVSPAESARSCTN